LNNLNSFFRAFINGAGLTYKSAPIAVLHPFDASDGYNAYIATSLFTDDKEQLEIGYTGSQSVDGFYQCMVILPDTDKGLDWALNDLVDQIELALPRGPYAESWGKVDIGGINRLEPLRIDGKASVTVRVNYSAYFC
jgi:hypothetical protein